MAKLQAVNTVTGFPGAIILILPTVVTMFTKRTAVSPVKVIIVILNKYQLVKKDTNRFFYIVYSEQTTPSKVKTSENIFVIIDVSAGIFVVSL